MSNTTDSLAREMIRLIAMGQSTPQQSGSGGVTITRNGRTKAATNPPPARELDSRVDLYE